MFSSFTDTCTHGPCYPGNEQCAAPHAGAPRFHLVDTRGCGLNDPNGPFWDPVHGVAHVFYQIHLAEKAVSTQGRGSDWGHFVSRDLVTWASMPAAIWNGLSLDEDAWPPRSTMYDTVAIFSGSALVVDGAGPGGKGDGVVMFYPGLCDTDDWPSCTQHDRDNEPVLLATAVPADYANDALLTNWSKPSYNPIWPAINHSGDPSTPWQMASGEWRIRTSDTVLGSASTSKLLSGEWYEIGQYDGFVDSNCPSLFPLPPPTPGTERAFEADRARGALPTHVQKTSACGIRPGAPPFHGCYDRWHVGTYDAATAPGKRGSFTPTPGWEDMFEHRLIDVVPSIVAVGNAAYYASKDGEFPPSVADGGKSRSNRRINFGYVLAPTPGQDLAQSGAHALPREVTFNALTRALQQAPLSEVAQLREAQPAFSRSRFDVEGGAYTLPLDAGVARQSELLVSFALPPSAPSDDAGDDADDESDAPITFWHRRRRSLRQCSRVHGHVGAPPPAEEMALLWPTFQIDRRSRVEPQQLRGAHGELRRHDAAASAAARGAIGGAAGLLRLDARRGLLPRRARRDDDAAAPRRERHPLAAAPEQRAARRWRRRRASRRGTSRRRERDALADETDHDDARGCACGAACVSVRSRVWDVCELDVPLPKRAKLSERGTFSASNTLRN